MNKERIQLLVDALRSGQFKQGRGRLAGLEVREGVLDKETRRYCCLGVACEVAVANGLDIPVNHRDDGGVSGYGEEHETAVLPFVVMEWYGFDAQNPLLLNRSGDHVSAYRANDNYKWTFEEIADGFERAFLGIDTTKHIEFNPDSED